MSRNGVDQLVMITHRFPMVSETFIMAHVEGLRDALVKIIPTEVNEQGLAAFPDLPSLEVIHPDPPPPGWMNQPGLKLRWKLQRRRAEYVYAWAPDVQDRLLKMLRGSGADHVLCEYGTIAAWSYPALVKSGLPFTIHFHGLDASSALSSRSYRDCLAAMLPRARDVIVVSDAMLARLREIAPVANYVKIPYGVKFSPSVQKNHDIENGCRLLAVGRLVPKKAPLLLLEAFSKARSRSQSELKLRLAGDGPLMPDVKRFIEERDLHESVTLLGAIPHEQVLLEMGSADMFVQHSVVAPDGDREGSPVAIMEAAGAGLPVVATRHEGICESVVEQETGLLVDEYDIDGMAAAIVRIADDRAFRESLSNQAAERAKAMFTMEYRINQLRETLGLPI